MTARYGTEDAAAVAPFTVEQIASVCHTANTRLQALANDPLPCSGRSSRAGHWHVRDAGGRLIAVASSTPSDHRSLRNFRGALRRAGAVR